MLVYKSVLATFLTCCWIATSVVSLPDPTATKAFDASNEAFGTPNVAYENPTQDLDAQNIDKKDPPAEPTPAIAIESSNEAIETPNIHTLELSTEPTPTIAIESSNEAIETPPQNVEPPQVSTKLQYSIAYISGSAAKREYFPVHFQDIDASGYTHLIYSFASIDEKYQLVFGDTNESAYLRELITHMKDKYPALRVLIAVGSDTATRTKNGIQERFTDQYKTMNLCPRTALRLLAKNLCTDILQLFHMDSSKVQSPRMINNAEARSTFIQSALSLIKEYGADGLDLDWEYLSALNSDGKVQDADNFVDLVRELRTAFPPEYYVTAAIPDGLSTYFAGIKVAEIVPHLNFITSMTFDLHGFWEYTTDKNASGGKLAAHTDIRDVKAGIDVTVAAGVPLEKLNLGLAFYGQAYKQAEPEKYEIGSLFTDPKTGMPDAGKSTGQRGVLGFNEINDLIVSNHTTVRFNKFDELTNTNIVAFGTDQWVSYDDEVTIKERLSYAYYYGLGGTTVRFLDLDDKDYQLSKAIKEMREKLISSVGNDVDIN